MKPRFSEIQRFNQWWLWLLLALPLAGLLLLPLFGLTDKHNEPITWLAILVPASILGLLLLWFLGIRLVSRVDEEGIHAHFRGIPFARKTYAWTAIDKAEVVEYSPVSEYGGWGVRYGIGNGWCYNVRGKWGLKLHLKNGKRFMLGTQQPQELTYILSQYIQ